MKLSTLRLPTAAAVVILASSSFMMAPSFAEQTETQTVQTSAESNSQSGYHNGKKSRGHGKGMHRMLRKLDLSDSQTEQVKLIVEKYKADNSGDREAMKQARSEHKQQMQALITASSFDEAQATTLIEAQQAEKQQKTLNFMKMQNEIYQVLTPEQQEKFEKMLERGKGKGKHSR
ncbi:Spy/CpxP family protein refolding chaperone [Shewanella maritima]|uniref:Spy/CpxP family protein refolding chaperone n=1 Tax=Shewanella maritima TaxID=2520507 RepID=UPI0037360436